MKATPSIALITEELLAEMKPEEQRLALGLLKVAAIRRQDFDAAAAYRTRAKAIRVKPAKAGSSRTVNGLKRKPGWDLAFLAGEKAGTRAIVFRCHHNGTSHRFDMQTDLESWKDTIRREAELLGMAIVPGGVA